MKLQAKKMFFVHPTAILESTTIGDGTRLWAYVHVLKGAVIGRNCNLGDHCYVEHGVRIGDDVVVKNGVSIWEGVTIENGAFIGPGVEFVNDRIPRAKLYHEHYRQTRIGQGASIGSNATILCDLTIGQYAVVGAGAVVTKDVGDYTIVVGNPAKPKGYACRCGGKLPRRERGTVRCHCGLVYCRREGAVRLISGE